MYHKNIFKKMLFSIFIIVFLFSQYTIYADDLDFDDESLDINNISTQETSSNLSEDSLSLNSRSCVVLDRISKQVLYGKNENKQVKMASTTKIMTAIIVIENYDLNALANISKKAANIGGSRLGLKSEDKITIHDLLYGLLLCSGNDAAVALAENVAGSIEDFSKLMNQKALDLNLTNTHFESPHGLDSDAHYTTAYELALLTDYALKNSTFSQIVGTKNYTITINGYPKSISNTNELLGNLNGVYGVKTGFTNGANRCLVTSCKRDNMDVICVVLGADTKKFRTQDSIKLIEYSFKNFEYLNIEEIANKELNSWKETYLSNLPVYKGVSNFIQLEISNLDYSIIPIKKELIINIETSISVNTYLAAPLHKGDVIGSIKIISNNNVISSINIICGNNIQKKTITDYLYTFSKNYTQVYENFISIF